MRGTWVMAAVLLVGAAVLSGAVAATPLDDIHRAEALIAVERFDRALAILKQIEPATDEDGQRLDLALGKIFLGMGKPARALDFFDKAAAATLEDGEATAGQAQCELAMGRLDPARRHAQAAITADAGNMAAQVVLALIDERTGKREQADLRLTNLTRDLPDSEEAAIARAQVIGGRNRNQAITLLDDFVRRHPFAPLAEDALGRAQWDGGKRAIALEHRRHAAALFSDRGNTIRADAIRAWIDGATTLPVEPGPAPRAMPSPSPPVREVGGNPLDPNRPHEIGPGFAEPFPFDPKFSGSGIVLEGGRHILTNRHVAEAGGTFAVRNGLGKVRRARVLGVSRQADLALLEIPEPFDNEDGLPLAQIVAPKTGRRIIVFGFPLPTKLGADSPSLTEGTVSKESGFRDDPTTFQMTARIEHGSSGGPVFDRNGDLVGVSVSVLFGVGEEIQAVSAAVNADSIAQFLNVGLGSGSGGPEVDPETFFQQMLGRVVLVVGK